MRRVRRAGALTASVLILAGLSASCTGGTTQATLPQAAVSADDTDWESAQGTVRLENNRAVLELDAQTGHFVITDKATGKAYHSVPEETGDVTSEDMGKRLASEITVRYYDENSTAHYMYASSDAVENGGLSVKSNGSAVRVYYTMGTGRSDLFVPQVLREADFTAIEESLSSSAARRLRLYYTLYTKSAPEEDFEAILDLYPALETENLYILDDSVSSLQRMDIDGYMQQAGYTKEQYDALVAELGISQESEDTPGFVVPVEYALTDDGLRATILTDKVEENSANYKLQQIDLLQFFSASNGADNGFYLVPDGSGARIRMTTAGGGTYSQDFYGGDTSLKEETATLLSQNAMLPVFGISMADGGLLGMVDGAAAAARMNVHLRGDASPLNAAWVSFSYRPMDVRYDQDMGTATGSATGEYNLYSTAPLTQLPAVNYSFLSAGAGEAEMAALCRQKLTALGVLQEDPVESAPLLLDYVCMVTREESILGFPYQKKIVLSTLADIEKSLQTLYDAGVENILVRLMGYGSSGLSHAAATSFELDKAVGTVEELESLAALVESHGGRLYLEADFQRVYSDHSGDGFDQRKDSSYYLDRTLVRRGQYHLVTREYGSKAAAFLVSPARYETYAAAFLDSLDAELPGGVTGISYAGAGTLLGGDYSSRHNLNRTAAVELLENALSASRERTGGLLVGGGNVYVLPYAEFLADLPAGSSSFDAQEDPVPFYQMVVHGRISYSSGAYNLAQDPQTALLRMVEYGASPQFMLMSKGNEALRDTEYQATLYSLCDEDWLDVIVEQASALQDYRTAVAGAAITAHDRAADGVYVTTYENGVRAAVNYTSQAVTVDGVSIAPMGFHIYGEE